MGSGETAPTMAKVHRQLLGRLGRPPVPAVLLDTPYGFQENADEITARALEYFRDNVGYPMTLAPFRSQAGGSARAGDGGGPRPRGALPVRGARQPELRAAQWRGTEVPSIVADKLRHGGIVTFASAAALTLGSHTRAGVRDLQGGRAARWLAGLDLLSVHGLPVAVIPHYDNAEGGTHDTRFCYLGERRLAVLESMLPAGHFVLGVDSHTALVLDFVEATATVMGLGTVTVRADGRSEVFASGHESCPSVRWRRPPSGCGQAGRAPRGTLGHTPGPGATGQAPWPRAGRHPLTTRSASWRRASTSSSAAGQVDGGGAAPILAMDQTAARLVPRHATAPTTWTVRATRSAPSSCGSGERAARAGRGSADERLAPLVELLIDLRGRARVSRDFRRPTSIRDALDRGGHRAPRRGRRHHLGRSAGRVTEPRPVRLRPSADSVLRIAELRWILVARASHAVGSSALLTVLGYQVYQLTRDPLALGLLGLVAGLPALALGLFGGHMADRRDRRTIIVVTSGALAVAVLVLAFISRDTRDTTLPAILAVVFLTGVASGFERPAMTAFEAQVIPLDRAAQGASWVSTMWTIGGLMGPALGGLGGGPRGHPRHVPAHGHGPGAVAPGHPPGGAQAGAGTGAWRIGADQRRRWAPLRVQAAAAVGRDEPGPVRGAVRRGRGAAAPLRRGHPGRRAVRAGADAHGAGAGRAGGAAAGDAPAATCARGSACCSGSVAGFGVAIIVFGLSTSFPLSMLALFALGATDAVSMVIRTVTVRIYSPEQMRGRIASVSYLFIGASNELGAFESGLAARFLGAVPAVLLGGVVTLFVTGLVAVFAPDLRRLDLRDATLEAEELATLEEWAAPG